MDDTNPFAAPQADLEPEDTDTSSEARVYRIEDRVVVEENARIPHRCVACNSPAEQLLSVSTKSRSPGDWMFMVLVIAVVIAISALKRYVIPPQFANWDLIALVLVLFIAHYATSRCRYKEIQFHLCTKHHSIRWIGRLLGLIGYIGLLLSRTEPEVIHLDVDIHFIALMLLFLAILMANSPWIRTAHSRNPVEGVELTGFGQKFLDSLPRHDELTTSDKT